MRFQRYMTGVAIAALLAGAAVAQTAPQSASQTPPSSAPPAAAGALNPAGAQAAPAAAPTPQFQMADGVFATVNDNVITGFDIRQRMLLLIAMTQVQPSQENISAIEREAVNALIEERLKIQEFANWESEGPIVSDAEVDEEIASRAQEAGTTAENYLRFLEQGGIRPETLRSQLRTEIGWQRLVGGRFQSRARPSKGAIDAAMRQISEAASKKQYLIGEVFIDATRVGGQQAAVNGANQLVQQMIQGAPFTNVAQQFSSAPSAVRGGDAGWVVEGTMPPAVQQAMEQLEVDQLSRPIPVEGGVYIIYMRDKRDGASTSLVQMKQVMIELPEAADAAQVATASQRLESLRPQLTCDTMLARATSEQGLLGADLGESDVANLAPQFQQVARSAEIGTVSTPVRTPLGLHLLGVCGRRAGGPEAPSINQVENQLFSQNLSNLGRRYIRDLRADALIEFKQ